MKTCVCFNTFLSLTLLKEGRGFQGALILSHCKPRQGTHRWLAATRSAQVQDAIEASIPQRISRTEGISLLDTTLLPTLQYGERIKLGKDSQRLDPDRPVQSDDPRLSLAYGEFPLQSTDELIDLALEYISANHREGPFRMLDLGSGCGRLVAYLALTRGTADQSWTVYGIEISGILHQLAERMTAAAADADYLLDYNLSKDQNHLVLHQGAAEHLTNVLGSVHLIFAYSTTWTTSGFSEELGAMVLSREWSELLGNSCSKGCVVVTTDRALDPSHGWQLVNKLEVDNREVMGSTGYIHVPQ